MKNKLKLAIASISLQFVLSILMRKFPYFAPGPGSMLSILHTLCTLGLLPFFVSLYRSDAFTALLKGDAAATENKQDENWLKHLVLRLSLFVLICIVLFLISAFEPGIGGAYLMAYGMAYTLGLAALLLVIETFVLFSRKCTYKASANMFLVIVAIWSLFEMM